MITTLSNGTNGSSNQNLNALRLVVKNIGGRLFRVNCSLNRNFTPNSADYKMNNDIRNSNNPNLGKSLSKVFSPSDDESSEENYSNNISFTDESDAENESENLHQTAKLLILDCEEDLLELSENSAENFVSLNNHKSKDSTQIFLPVKQFSTNINSIRWTHFLSIPLHLNKDFVEKFEFFKKKIIEENFLDVEEEIFQNKNRLHMTICLFQLDQSKSDLVGQVIKDSENMIKKLLDGSPLYIDFDSLDIFGSQTKSKVLYAHPKSSDKLKDLIDLFVSKFIEKGLITEEMKAQSYIYFNEEEQRYELEKMHVTLMNTKFLKLKAQRNLLRGESSQNQILFNSTSKNNFNPTFNGIKILKRMKNFSFGVQKIDEIILNEMKIDYKTDTYKVCYKHKF